MGIAKLCFVFVDISDLLILHTLILHTFVTGRAMFAHQEAGSPGLLMKKCFRSVGSKKTTKRLSAKFLFTWIVMIL